jgi:hypothetical protein
MRCLKNEKNLKKKFLKIVNFFLYLIYQVLRKRENRLATDNQMLYFKTR